jgi:hypothetical protein
MPNYYLELPEGYKIKKIVDAKKDKKLIILMNIIATVLMIITMITLYFVKKIKIDVNLLDLYIFLLLFIISSILYIVCHELVHGVVYKILTKQKLTFGLTLIVAFCGVPNIYTTRKTALYALFAPLVVFTLIFIPLIILLPANIYGFLVILLFATHFGGCIGDMYCIYLLLFKLPKNTLVNDTGPKQTFYVCE